MYRAGHIAGARSISIWEADADDKVKALFAEGRDQSAPIVVYCSGGDCEDSHMLGAEALLRRLRQRARLQGRLPRLGEARPARHEGRRALSGRLTSPWLTTRVQFVLAAVFVVAGFGKIVDPPGFAHEIHNYKLCRASRSTRSRSSLPWIEVVSGLALFVGVARRSLGADLRRAPDRLRDRALDQPRARPAGGLRLLRGARRSPKTEAERLRDMKSRSRATSGLLLLVGQVLSAIKREERDRR